MVWKHEIMKKAVPPERPGIPGNPSKSHGMENLIYENETHDMKT